jgi:hypothetical protein
MDRYELKVYFHDKKNDPFGMSQKPDLIGDLKTKAEVYEWIDDTVRKVTLYDRVRNELSILKDE